MYAFFFHSCIFDDFERKQLTCIHLFFIHAYFLFNLEQEKDLEKQGVYLTFIKIGILEKKIWFMSSKFEYFVLKKKGA